MSNRSAIEWTDYTSNPIVPVEGGRGYAIDEEEINLLINSKEISGKRVFVCDMCDLFHTDVQDEMVDQVFAVFALRQDVTWQVLTKRPERMAAYLHSHPKYLVANVWLGVSVENQELADDRIPYLLQCPAAVRFLSCEPLLGRVGLSPHLERQIDWVIVGGESGPMARPCEVDWMRSIIQQCDLADVPCFVKQLGGRKDKRSNPNQWPEDLRVRQFPAR